MGRRFRISDEGRRKKGRGTGRGKDYQAWLQVGDSASSGFSGRFPDPHLDRPIHGLATTEEDLFWTLRWCPQVTEIREQYPLPLEVTRALALQMGIKHPQAKPGPVVQTVDFLVTERREGGDKDVGYAFKLSRHLENPRTIEKLELQKQACWALGIEWRLRTEFQVNLTFADNVRRILRAKDLSYFPHLTYRDVLLIEPILFDTLKQNEGPYRYVGWEIDERFGLEPGSSLTIIWFLILHRVWIVDMDLDLDPNLGPLNVLDRFPLPAKEPGT